MLPISTYSRGAERRPREQGKPASGRGWDDMYSRAVMEREKTLLTELIRHLEQEIDYVIGGDITALEESMPQKKKVLEAIDANRQATEAASGPEGSTADLRGLRQELVMLWKRASGLNESSKEMVNQRLNEIQMRLEPFFLNLKGGYNRTGKASKAVAHTIKAGV